VSTLDDVDCRRSHSEKVGDVPTIARQDLVAARGHQYHCRIDYISRTRPGQQHAGRSADRIIDRTNLDTSQEASEMHLTTPVVAPHLSDDIRVRPQRPTRAASGDEQRHDLAIVPIDANQRASVKNAASPSRSRARANSSPVIGPCSVSQAWRNSSKASRRSFSAAASANQPDSPLPARRADVRID
jgi:hypothetical protein